MINNKQIMEEISKHSPHTEQLVISTLMAVKYNINIINKGSAGLGKSYGTVELLRYLDIPFELISGHITPRALFDILKKDRLTIIDESATLIQSYECVNMLLGSLWSGLVIWKNNREEETHQFKGCIIFNTNSLMKNEFVEALKDRCIVNNIELNSEQINEKIKSSLDYKPNNQIWLKIRENLKNDYNLSKKDLDTLFGLISGFKVKSMRDFWKLKHIAMFSKIFMGDFSLINYFFKKDPLNEILNSNLKKSVKIKELSKVTGKSIRFYQRKFKEKKL